MSETVEKRMDREYAAWHDCLASGGHEFKSATLKTGVLNGWYRQCAKCRCWSRTFAPPPRDTP